MKDITGKRFDDLVAIKYSHRKGKRHYWKCQCDCGNTVVISEYTLRNKNRHHSCGCYSKQFLIPADKNHVRMIGRIRAQKRNVNGCNVDMIFGGNIKTNTSGRKGVYMDKKYRKWGVSVGYRNYRCTLGFFDIFDEAVKMREAAEAAIKDGTFEEFFFQTRGYRMEEKLKRRERTG